MSDEREKHAAGLSLKTFDEIGETPPRDTPHDRIEHDSTPVRVRGDAPHSILWRGRQWAVTEYGIEALDGTYPIEASRLHEDFASESPGWIRHMGEKNWVDIADFTTAFMVAIVLHGYAKDFDRERVMKQYRKAVRGL